MHGRTDLFKNTLIFQENTFELRFYHFINLLKENNILTKDKRQKKFGPSNFTKYQNKKVNESKK